MSEMVERVRDAIADWMGGCQEARCTYPMSDNCECALAARAAIEAMREPTEAMTGNAKRPVDHPRFTHYDAAFVWRAMIDAALVSERGAEE